MSTTITPLILVYFNVRGKMQPIRNLLRYLQLDYMEVHPEDEEQKKKLPAEVLSCLKGVRIDKASLPLLVYQGLYLYDIYPIMAFLCRKFKRQDLLGRDIRQRTRLQQILQIFFLKQPRMMEEVLKLSDFAHTHSGDQLLKEKKTYMLRMLNDEGYLKEACLYLEQQGKPDTFIFETLTILDFLFLEGCHFMLGLFNNMDIKMKCPISNMLLSFFSCGPPEKPAEELRHLETMRNFINFMYSQPFYVKNRDFLESFSIVSPHCSHFTAQRIDGLRKLWVYNKKFVQ